ncbi:20861_t:CDS:2, partial [Gigaspora rosea]
MDNLRLPCFRRTTSCQTHSQQSSLRIGSTDSRSKNHMGRMFLQYPGNTIYPLVHHSQTTIGRESEEPIIEDDCLTGCGSSKTKQPNIYKKDYVLIVKVLTELTRTKLRDTEIDNSELRDNALYEIAYWFYNEKSMIRNTSIAKMKLKEIADNPSS